MAGTWLPIVTDEFGIIPVDPSVASISIPFTVTDVTPGSDLNPYGGTILTITGTALPQTFTEGNTCEVTFSDSSKCEILAVSGTSIRCMTSGFTSGTTSVTLTVIINGVSVEDATALTVRAIASSVLSVTPDSVSPVLKKPVTIELTDYTGTLVKEDLEVTIIARGVTPPIVRMMNVLEVGVTGTNHYIKCLMGGSESGVYDLKVHSRTYGRFDTSGKTLTLVGKVTDFNPKSGSIHGGTLITIDGYHFSTDYQDNPVRLGYTDCLVETSTPTQLTCRTVARHEDARGIDPLIVFLKTYEEAICADELSLCKYQWTDDTHITQYSTVYDEADGHYMLKFVGVNLGDNLNS